MKMNEHPLNRKYRSKLLTGSVSECILKSLLKKNNICPRAKKRVSCLQVSILYVFFQWRLILLFGAQTLPFLPEQPSLQSTGVSGRQDACWQPQPSEEGGRKVTVDRMTWGKRRQMLDLSLPPCFFSTSLTIFKLFKSFSCDSTALAAAWWCDSIYSPPAAVVSLFCFQRVNIHRGKHSQGFPGGGVSRVPVRNQSVLTFSLTEINLLIYCV